MFNAQKELKEVDLGGISLFHAYSAEYRFPCRIDIKTSIQLVVSTYSTFLATLDINCFSCELLSCMHGYTPVLKLW